MSDDQNPYSPPSSRIAPDALFGDGLPDAGLGRRFATNVVDGIGIQLFSMPVAVAIALVWPGFLDSTLNSFIYGLGLFIVYYLVFEATVGRTPGKFVAGTRVVSDQDQPPSGAAILKRTAIRLIPFEPFSFFGPASPRGWHDTWSQTRVVNLRAPAGDSARPPQSDVDSGAANRQKGYSTEAERSLPL